MQWKFQSEFIFHAGRCTKIAGDFRSGVTLATFTTIFYFIPATPPFFAPGKWALTMLADFFRQISLVVSHYRFSSP